MKKLWDPSKFTILKDDSKDIKRSEDVYMVSKILSSSLALNTITLDLFINLNFSHFDWNTGQPSEEIMIYKNELIEYEKLWYKKSDKKFSNDFDRFFQQKYFANIGEIEEKISDKLGREFEFQSHLFASSSDKVLNKIVAFYNFLCASKIFNEEQIIQLIIFFDTYQEDENNFKFAAIKGAACGDNVKSFVVQKMTLKSSWHSQTELDNLFAQGQSTNNDMINTFVHEFGHIIHNFYGLNHEIRSLLNMNIPTNFVWENDEDFEKICNDFNFNNFFSLKRFNKIVVDGAYDYIVRKVQKNYNKHITNDYSQKINNILVTFASWVAVPSLYGRQAIFDDQETIDYNLQNHLSIHKEWFAEGFAFWYLTPAKDRNKIWDYWHQLFTQELPKRFNNFNE